MKKQILLLANFLMLFLHAQENLREGFSYSFVDKIPRVGGITTDFNDFKFTNEPNHYLDKESGAISCIKGGNHKIEISLNNIGRLVFYTKIILDKIEDDRSLGDYRVNFFREKKLIKREKRDLSQNWSEFHFNINEFNINKVVIEFNPKIEGSVIVFDKMKIRGFTDEGIQKLEEEYKQKEVSKTVDANFDSQKKAMIDLSISNIKTLIYFNRKLDAVSAFVEGETLGAYRQKALNPFNYPRFNSLYKEIITNASRAERLKIEELEKSISKNNWVNVVGNVTDVLTGGMFSSLVNSLKNIINSGARINSSEIFVLNSKLFELKKSSLKLIPQDSKLAKDYREIHKKYSGYIEFIEILGQKQLIEIKEQEKFNRSYNKKELIKTELLNLLSDIISGANLTLEDGYFKRELDSETLISKFRKKTNIDQSNFLNYKIKGEIVDTKVQNISSVFYEFISNFKTYYDNKYSFEKLDPEVFQDINIDKKIKDEWKKNLRKISKKYIKSSELKKLQNLSKK